MILVLNCGSQSIKWKIFNKKLEVVDAGKCDVLNQEDFQACLERELAKIDLNVQAGRTQINLIGHRVVHGKDIFKKPTVITKENINDLEPISHFAPLHNPFNIAGIKTCQIIFENIPNIAVFDTEFFSELPEKAYTYALPEFVNRICLPAGGQGFRRYGFHGTSHEYVARKASEALKKPFNRLKIITCHLGGGASIAAIKNGKAIDTSMGFTPMEGLVMMTRCGNIDAGVVLDLVKGFTLDKAREILNKESGIKGICGENEMLKVLLMAKAGDKKAKLAFDVFVYSIKKYIGSYFAILGGCDALVFTGSIGSGLKVTRNAVCKDLDILKKPPRGASLAKGGTKILAITTDEELAIAEKIIKLK